MVNKLVNEYSLNNNKYFINYIYLYVFILPWNLIKPQMGIMTSLLFIFWVISIINARILNEIKSVLMFKPILFMFLFILFSFLSLLWSEDVQTGLYSINYFKYYIIVIPIFITSLGRDEAMNALKYFCYSLTLYAFFSISIYLGLFTSLGFDANDPKGIFRYMITTSYMAIGVFLTTYFFFKEESYKKQIIFLLFALICLIGLFVNNGRAAQVSFFMTVFLLICIYRKYFYSFKRIIALAIAVLFIVFLISQNTFLIKRYKHTINEVNSYVLENRYNSSPGERLKMYNAGLHIFVNNFFIGVGAGDSRNSMYQYNEINNISMPKYLTFHNLHIELLVKFGIIGYSLFLLSLYYLVKYYRKSDYFLLGFIFVVYHVCVSLFDSILYYKPYNNVFLILFILLVTIVFNNKNVKKVKIENNS